MSLVVSPHCPASNTVCVHACAVLLGSVQDESCVNQKIFMTSDFLAESDFRQNITTSEVKSQSHEPCCQSLTEKDPMLMLPSFFSQAFSPFQLSRTYSPCLR